MLFNVQTKRVYDARSRSDGKRVLVMRLWPRGVRKAQVDLWLRELGAPLPLVRAWKKGKIAWLAFTRGYLASLKAPPARTALARLRQMARRGPITLLCACPEESRCHRGLLKQHLGMR